MQPTTLAGTIFSLVQTQAVLSHVAGTSAQAIAPAFMQVISMMVPLLQGRAPDFVVRRHRSESVISSVKETVSMESFWRQGGPDT